VSLAQNSADSADPYASHLRFLALLGRKFPLASVLEFGIGRYSTAQFLDRQVYPDLHSLLVVEDDGKWLAEMSAQLDQRVQTLLVNRSDDAARDIAKICDPRQLDLIFIDSGGSLIDRLKVISAVATMDIRPDCMVVCHDTHRVPYQKAMAKSFRHTFQSRLEKPFTTCGWNENAWERSYHMQGLENEFRGPVIEEVA